jgi:HEAT repeat protein
MNLIAKIFGTRSPLTAPAHTVYLLPGESLPLRAAIETITSSTDNEFIAICISHYSGYVREAAIGRAVELGHCSFLEPITERVNDWVPEVRRAATNALLTLLATVSAEHFVLLIPRLRRLMLATRTDHRSWLFEFERCLVEAGGAKAIIAAMTGTDFRLRRAAFLVAVDHQLLQVSETIELGLNSGDIVLAQRAINLLDGELLSDRAKYIALAVASPFGPIRLAALNLLADDQLSSDYEPFLWRAVLDSQGSLRSVATRLLIELGRDVIGRCSAMLGAGELTARQVRAALSLLAEHRAPELVSMLTRYASDTRTEVRAHAIGLQAKTLPTLKDEVAARALLDPSRKVRKAGVRLCTCGAFVSLGLVKAMLVQHGDRHAALTVCVRDRWDSLTCIALVTELSDPADNGYSDVKKALKHWIEDPTASWTKPNDEHRLILSNPEVASRLVSLAEDRHPELRARLREGGIEL